MTKKIVIVGTGGHAASCVELVESTKEFSIVGLIGQAQEVGTEIYGYPVIGDDSALGEIFGRANNALIGIGKIFKETKREHLYKKMSDFGFTFPAIISPTAVIAKNVRIGRGSVIMHNCVLNLGAEIGDNCIVNTGAIIEHGATVGSQSHISTAAVLNGNVSVGQNCFIGSNTVIKQGIKIGDFALVNMGLKILHDVEPGEVLR